MSCAISCGIKEKILARTRNIDRFSYAHAIGDGLAVADLFFAGLGRRRFCAGRLLHRT